MLHRKIDMLIKPEFPSEHDETALQTRIEFLSKIRNGRETMISEVEMREVVKHKILTLLAHQLRQMKNIFSDSQRGSLDEDEILARTARDVSGRSLVLSFPKDAEPSLGLVLSVLREMSDEETRIPINGSMFILSAVDCESTRQTIQQLTSGKIVANFILKTRIRPATSEENIKFNSQVAINEEGISEKNKEAVNKPRFIKIAQIIERVKRILRGLGTQPEFAGQV